ncbi:hypothetical protein GS636_09155 [Ruegeria sp. HKCCD4884]|uniref:NusA N-terminal domain-containing protein n=1 Tax=Ruegeria sp. HKCCD4884 TaxID=2683022 RepID=UPI001490AA53|nr:NusA N-terminal domain-containing protein [Ruegeria sp. HKCCD4884]NOD92948.1 hypothetical protein [Ruegeria sp. HKCCD4884]
MTDDIFLDLPEEINLKGERNLLVLANVLIRQQQIPQETASREIEAAYVRAAEAEYGAEYEFWAKLKKDGSIELAQVLKVVDVMLNEYREVALTDIRNTQSDAELGHYVVNPVPPIHPHRISEWLRSGETQIRNLSINVR